MSNHYAVIGNPVAHSLSPQIHQAFAKQKNISLLYEKIESPLDDFVNVVKMFQQKGGSGCNVTVPFKEQAFQLATKASAAARLAEAANTLIFKDNGEIVADNTDGIGFVQDLTNNHDFSLQQKRVLLIGAGGAAAGILGHLLEKAPSSVVIANRTLSKAKELQKRFQSLGEVRAVSLEEINGDTFDLIINATSLGHQNKMPAIPTTAICQRTVCYDLSYGDAAKPFLTFCAKNKADKCLDGLGMLVEQAAASFCLWHHTYPETRVIIDMLRVLTD